MKVGSAGMEILVEEHPDRDAMEGADARHVSALPVPQDLFEDALGIDFSVATRLALVPDFV